MAPLCETSVAAGSAPGKDARKERGTHDKRGREARPREGGGGTSDRRDDGGNAREGIQTVL
eukprot:9483627-Pyramimonas_sp.AAC.1